MKRLIAFFIVMALCVSVAACAVDNPFSNPTEPSVSQFDPSFSDDFPVELQQYCAPWAWDAVAGAKADGMVHYYFMSGKHMLMDARESDPYKWGDSTLIVFPNGQTMLIDVGMAAYAPVLAQNLRRLGIKRLDYLMVSHPHSDHIGGIIAPDCFFDMVQVDAVIYSGVDRGEKSDLLYASCTQRNIPIQIVKQGDVFEFDAVRMEVIWPKAGTDGKKITKTAAINNQSIIARFDYNAHSSLFVGDLYASGEAQVIGECWDMLDVDLLKVPHHGYPTSSSGLFIESVSPKVAVAMSAHRYSVQRAYETRGITFLYDQYEGYIHVKSDGTKMTYDTEKNN